MQSRDLRLLRRVLIGKSDANIRFDDIRRLLVTLGFEERIRGSHRIFTKEGVLEILNLQPRGAMAKPYQVRQIRRVIIEYGMVPDDT